MSRNKRKNAEERKKEIIESALELFILNGYENVTMNMIAKESGVVKGLCYHYFPSKEVLYEEALAIFVQQLISEFDNIIQDQTLSLEERMDEMALVLKKHQGNSLFYDFSRKTGNKRVYIDILYQSFQSLIPKLAEEYRCYANLPKHASHRLETLMSFLLYGQLGILTEKENNFDEQLKQIKEYINTLLKSEYKKEGE